MQKVLIFSNRDKTGVRQVATEIASYLKKRGVTSVHHRYDVNGVSKQLSGSKQVQQVDFAICIGGDGTALHLCRVLAKQQIPILTINYGHLGFITEFSVNDWAEAIDGVLAGTYEVEERILIDVQVMGAKKARARLNALNDAVVSIVGISKLTQYEVYIGNQLLASYRADGLIVATPTGSTAYSVAAGGPILHPALTALVVNPICPFTLSHRPIVIPTTEKITILPQYVRGVSMVLTLDGQEVLPLEPGQRVEIMTSQTQALIVRSPQYSFYEAIRQKLKWSGATDAD